jgi:prepilin-type N-terminal cleavage/methylation domain-containing protein
LFLPISDRQLVDQLEPESRERGFTIVEMMVVILITGFVFLALATLLAGAAKSLSVAKTRSQANEIATQGIEDLQRYDFNNLGLCSGVADPAPATIPSSLAGLTSVQLANCGSGSLIYSQPCSPPSGTLTSLAVPRQTYTCVKNGISYSVSRYVMWADAAHTAKRLAVYLGWTDTAGIHQVAQESSLRSPNAASVIGLTPPQFVSVSVTAPNPVLIADDGTLLSTMTFGAVTNGLSPSDQVFVTLDTLVTQPDLTVAALPQQFSLVSGNGVDWSLSLPGSPAPVFGAGSQYVTFTEVRNSADGKANSKISSTTLKFCPAAGCPLGLPTITSATVSPTSINIDSSGVLQSTFTVSAVTTGLDFAASVTVTLQTQTGAASLQLPASNSCVSGGSCNNWTATFAPGSLNLRFLPGNQILYVTATQPVNGTGGTNGSSAVATTNTVTFS